MKSKIILYIAVSVDGFIASKDLSVKWLDKYFNKKMGNSYKKFFKTISSVILGNTTHKQFPQKYEGKPTFVFSRKKKDRDENITYVKGSAKSFMKKYNPKGKVWLLGGAEIINHFLKDNLVNEMRIFIMPEILGDGVRLFKKKNKGKIFKLINKKSYGNVIELHYKK